MSFDRNRLIDNIYRFAREEDVKIGALEQKAGVSPGYLSRLLKDDSKGSFGVDLLCSAAEQLGKTLDALVYTSYEELSENERTLIDFFDKLTVFTEDFSLEWDMMPPQFKDPSYLFNNTPFFKKVSCHYDDPDGCEHYFDQMQYCSRFFAPEDVSIGGDCFYTLFDKSSETVVTIMNVSAHDIKTHDGKEGILEVYFVTGNKPDPILCTEFACDQVNAAVRRLYNSVEAARSHLSLKPNSMQAIDRFLKGQDTNE